MKPLVFLVVLAVIATMVESRPTAHEIRQHSIWPPGARYVDGRQTYATNVKTISYSKQKPFSKVTLVKSIVTTRPKEQRSYLRFHRSPVLNGNVNSSTNQLVNSGLVK